MNAPAPQTFDLISCERGLGRMQPSACARRWKIAGTAPSAQRAADRPGAAGIRNSPCRSCEHGERRHRGGLEPEANLVQVMAKRSPDVVEVLPTPQHHRARIEIEDRLRVPARPVLPEPATAEQPKPEEKPMAKYNTRTCEYEPCSKPYTPTGAKQRFHNKTCKVAAARRDVAPKGGGSKAPTRARKERAPVAEFMPAPPGTGYRVRVGRLEIDCATLKHVVDLVAHFGGGS